jgi:PKHD-type hydroxylase
MLICIPDILDRTEIETIRAAIGSGVFLDGHKTAGPRAKRVKNNEQMDQTTDAAKEVKARVLAALKRSQTFHRVTLPRTVRPPLISRYRAGMNYGPHVDDAMMGRRVKERSDISVTVFLSDPGDYEGGELVMNSPFGRQEIKLPAGHAVVYPASTLHQVAPVTRGERLAAVTWVRSQVRDPARREILYDICRMREKLAKLHPDDEEADLAFKTHANLLRMWSE